MNTPSVEVPVDRVFSAKVISNWRVTIPTSLRRRLRIKPGDMVVLALVSVEKP